MKRRYSQQQNLTENPQKRFKGSSPPETLSSISPFDRDFPGENTIPAAGIPHYVYRVIVSPDIQHNERMTTKIKVDGRFFWFEGFLLLSYDRLSETPHRLQRSNQEFTLHLSRIDEAMPFTEAIDGKKTKKREWSSLTLLELEDLEWIHNYFWTDLLSFVPWLEYKRQMRFFFFPQFIGSDGGMPLFNQLTWKKFDHAQALYSS